MKWLANLLYAFMRLLVVISYRIFYAKITVINPEKLHFKGPGIIVSNHPSTLMDPLNTGIQTNRRISFLANAGLFKNPAVAAFLNIYCIPVERPKDVNGRRINNADNFARADEYLANGGVIYIAPEGTSTIERRLRPLKTGTARIALSAEHKQDFNLGLKIIPVGLTYTAPKEFRSEVLLNVGDPIGLQAYAASYQNKPFVTAKKLTADLQERMQSLVFHTEKEETEVLLYQIQTLLQSEDAKKPAPHFLRSKEVQHHLLEMPTSDFEKLRKQAKDYYSSLAEEGLSDSSFYRALHAIPHFLRPILLIIGLPFFFYGYINNLLPFGIPGWIAHRLKIYHGYIPAAKTLGGLIFVPLFYYLQSKFVARFFGPELAWAYLFSLLPMGWIAWKYRALYRRWISDRQGQRVKRNKPQLFNKLQSQRKTLVDLLQPHFDDWKR